MTHETINDQFKDYLQTVYTDPPTPGSVQFKELRRTFYAAYMAALIGAQKVAGNLPELEAMHRMTKWMNEGLGFVQSVKERNI